MISAELFIVLVSSVVVPVIVALAGGIAWMFRFGKRRADEDKTITETAVTLAKELREELKLRQTQIKELEIRLDEFETRIDVLETVATRLAHGIVILGDQMAHEGIEPAWKPSGMVKAFLDQFVEEVYSDMGKYRGHKNRE